MAFRNIFLVGGAMLLLALGGCAFGDRQANLQYPPKAESEAGVKTTAAATTAPATGAARTIAITRFKDERAERSVVGHVRNGWGMKTADVISPTDVSAWVADALKWELEQVGYHVIPRDGTRVAETDRADAAISGQVIRTYADAYFSYEGEVTFRVEVTKNDGTVFDRHYTGTAGGGINMAATGASYAQTLSLALQDGLRQFMADFGTALDTTTTARTSEPPARREEPPVARREETPHHMPPRNPETCKDCASLDMQNALFEVLKKQVIQSRSFDGGGRFLARDDRYLLEIEAYPGRYAVTVRDLGTPAGETVRCTSVQYTGSTGTLTASCNGIELGSRVLSGIYPNYHMSRDRLSDNYNNSLLKNERDFVAEYEPTAEEIDKIREIVRKKFDELENSRKGLKSVNLPVGGPDAGMAGPGRHITDNGNNFLTRG